MSSNNTDGYGGGAYGDGEYGSTETDSTDDPDDTDEDMPETEPEPTTLIERVSTQLTTDFGTDRVSANQTLPDSAFRPDFQVELGSARLIVETESNRDSLDSAVGQVLKYARLDRLYLPVLAVPATLYDEADDRVPDAVSLVEVSE